VYSYLLINLLAVLIPVIVSFDRRNYFFAKWKYLFPAIALTGLFFVLWDIIFTHWGIWGFNPRYITGLHIFNLPLEEVLFFICIPFACVFTYDSLNYLIKKDYLRHAAVPVSYALTAILLITAFLNITKLYTSVTFILTSGFLMFQILYLRPSWLGRFYLAYIVLLVPFFIINGILTGTWLEEQIVWYDNSMNLSLRIGTIPVEDMVYGFFLILMNISIYEFLKKNKKPGS
jgi:lycopene cyclase domain-containing protein